MTPEAENGWPALPTETEIYILPNGEIVVADLPVELAAQLRELTQIQTQDANSSTDAHYVADQQHPTQPI
jgi:hypothetical protein